MRRLVIVAAVLFACGATAGVQPPARVPDAVAKARKQFLTEAARAEVDHRRTVAKAADAYRTKLKEALDAETKAGQLDMALLLRDEIRGLEAGVLPAPDPKAAPPEPKAAPPEPKAAPPEPAGEPPAGVVPGTYAIVHHPNRATRTYVITPAGAVRFVEEGRNGVLAADGRGAFLLDFGDDGKVERVTFAAGRVFTEVYDPRRNFARNPKAPTQVGIGELVRR